MKVFKPALFLFGFAILNLIVIKFTHCPEKEAGPNEPGWQEQFKAMKNNIDGISYYGIRNSWHQQGILNKKSSDALNAITEVGPTKVGGRVRALLIDASDSLHILAGGISGGLWVTSDGGKSWKAIADQNLSMAVSCITQNPFNPKEIYYGTGESVSNSADINGAGVFKSTDGGITFSQLQSTATLSAFASIWDIEFSKTDSSTFYIGLASGGLYRTRNSGLTFKQEYVSSRAVHEIVTYKDSTFWFSLEGNGIFSSTEDSFIKVVKFTSILPTTGIGRVSMNYCTKFPDVAFCQILNSSGTSLVGIYKTSNHGVTWKKITSPASTVYPWGWYCLNTNVSPSDTNFVLAIAVEGVASVNGGTTWNKMQDSHPDFHTSSFFASGRNFILGTDGGLYQFKKSTAFSSNVSLNNGLNITQFYTGNYHPSDSRLFIGGTQDNGTHFYDASNFSFVYGGDGSYCAMSATPPYYNYVSSQNGEIRRMNKDFIGTQNIKPSGSYAYWFINPFEVNPLDGNQLYILSKTRILVSTNSGTTYGNLSNSLNKQVLSLGMSYQKDPTIYFGGGGTTLYRCSNGATQTLKEVDLTATSPPLARGSVINSIKVNHSNPNTIYISMSDINIKPRVWKLNGAESSTPTWTNISGNLPVSLPVNCIEVNPYDSNAMVAGTDFGLYSTSDGGKNWSKETGVPNVPVWKVVSHPKNGVVYIFTHGRGIFKSQFKNFVPTTRIALNDKHSQPVSFNNPVENYLELTLTNQNERSITKVQLVNSSGMVVLEENINANSKLDLSRFSKGLYILRLRNDQFSGDYKVLKL